ncbi:MAG: DUF5011 domain-containing protein [Ruminococcus sp.]|nr:DUF5011 domain-containing protein [Ruminococcus sp.]
MKKILILPAVTAVLFCGCGDKAEGSASEKVPAATSAVTVTTAPETTENLETTTVCAENEIPEDVVISGLEEVEVYSDVTLGELLRDSNFDVQDHKRLIDTSELGEHDVEYVFDYKGKSYEGTFTYTVADTTPPLCLNSGWNPYAKKGEPFDPDTIVGFADNYDRDPKLSYTGEVDTSTVGNYPITVTVTDSSGNETSWETTVFVLNEIPAAQDNNPRITFREFMDKYCYENVSYGIDVSAWQTNVDYEAVKAQGCEFVLMRMGYCYDEIKMDDYYEQNIANASAAGLDVGVYFYTTANTEEKAREQARWIVEQLDGRQLDYPIAFDWEEWARFQQYGMSIHDLNEIFEAFCDELEKNGYSGMLYSSKNFLNNFWENRNNRTVWLAHYVDETDYEGTFAIWQASAYGRMEGISGDVDLNIRVNEVPVY